MTDLPDDIRVPLHELHADVDYLIGRVAADKGCASMIAASIKDKLAAIEANLVDYGWGPLIVKTTHEVGGSSPPALASLALTSNAKDSP